EMVVREARRPRGHDSQVAGHPEVQEEGAGFQAQKQVLGAPSDAEDPLPGDLARQIARYPPAQPRLVDLERDDPLLERVGLEAPARGLDFGQLGQALAKAFTLSSIPCRRRACALSGRTCGLRAYPGAAACSWWSRRSGRFRPKTAACSSHAWRLLCGARLQSFTP